MSELREKARHRSSRSVPAAVRSNRVVSSPFEKPKRCAISAAAPISAEGDKSECKAKEEVAKLQYALQESEERINLLETLLREKELLQRRDVSLEARMAVYEEQLNHIANSLKKESTSLRAALPDRREEKSATANTATTEARCVSTVERITEGIQQLHCENKRLQGELQRKDRLVAALRAELSALAPEKNSDSQSLPCELPISSASDFGKKTAAEKSSEEIGEKSRVDALEHRVVQLQGRHVRAEEQLAESRKDCYRMKQLLRVKEKELYALQRNCNELAESAPVVPKVEEKLISTQHRQYFKGEHWPQLMADKPHALETAFLKDVSLALCVPFGHIEMIEMLPGPSLVTIEVNVQHTSRQSFEEIEENLCAHEFPAMLHLLEHRDDPRDGWDLVDQKLRESLETLSARDAELDALRCRLTRVESSLDRREDEREEDTTLVTHVLDETERTMREIYGELDRQRAETRTAKDSAKTIRCQLEEALAAKDAEFAQQLRRADDEKKEEMAAARLQLSEHERELLRQAEDMRPTQIINVAVSHVWNAEAAVDIPLHLESGAVDILRVLLLGDISAACRCAALCVSFMDYDAREIRAELQVLVAPSAAKQVEKAVHECALTAAMRFLLDLRATNAFLEQKSAEARRLADELKDAKSAAAELVKEHKRVTAAVETQRQQREEWDGEAKAKVEKANAFAQETLAACEEAKEAARKAAEVNVFLEAENQRVKAEAQTAKTEAEKAKAMVESLSAEIEAAKAETQRAKAELQAALAEQKKEKEDEDKDEAAQRKKEEAQTAVAEKNKDRKSASTAPSHDALSDTQALNVEVLRVCESVATESEEPRASARDHLCAANFDCGGSSAGALRLSVSLSEMRTDSARASYALDATTTTAHRLLQNESDEWGEAHRLLQNESDERFARGSRRLADVLYARNSAKDAAALKSALAARDALQEKLSAQEEKLSAQEEKLSAQQEKLSAQEEKLSTLQEELSAQQEKLSAQKEKLSAQQEELSAQQNRNAALAADAQELRARLAESQSSAAETTARLKLELASHREQASVIVKTIARESDTRRQLEREVHALREKVSQWENHPPPLSSSPLSLPPDVQRLQTFCARTLRMPRANSLCTVGALIAEMEMRETFASESLASAAATVAAVRRVLCETQTQSQTQLQSQTQSQSQTQLQSQTQSQSQTQPPILPLWKSSRQAPPPVVSVRGFCRELFKSANSANSSHSANSANNGISANSAMRGMRGRSGCVSQSPAKVPRTHSAVSQSSARAQSADGKKSRAVFLSPARAAKPKNTNAMISAAARSAGESGGEENTKKNESEKDTRHEIAQALARDAADALRAAQTLRRTFCQSESRANAKSAQSSPNVRSAQSSPNIRSARSAASAFVSVAEHSRAPLTERAARRAPMSAK